MPKVFFSYPPDMEILTKEPILNQKKELHFVITLWFYDILPFITFLNISREISTDVWE